jgi:hypothetical protein
MLSTTLSSDVLDVAKLSPRAIKRMRILARLLMGRGFRFYGDAATAMQQVLKAAQRQKDRDALREQVDWVEAYEQVWQQQRQCLLSQAERGVK